MRDYFYSLMPAFFGSVVMALTLLAFRFAGTTVFKLSDVWLLTGSVTLGAVIYFAALKAAGIQALDEMITLGQEAVRPFATWMIAKMPWAQKNVAHVGLDEEGQKYTIYIHRRK
ncbi:MAG: hypothetical protein NTY03_04515, partial [Candidatus Bathyarchaeota archaeon]|nr:hypothetical protein [Candidatus Bathyarchaeota archaeon]